MSHPGEVKDIDGWKQVADTLNKANTTLVSHGLHAGYHNHELEWKLVDGQKPIELLAANTDKSIMLQWMWALPGNRNDPSVVEKSGTHSSYIARIGLGEGLSVLFWRRCGSLKKLFAAPRVKPASNTI